MGGTVRRLANRRPLVFCVLAVISLFVLTALSRLAFPRRPVGDIEQLPEKAFEPPTGLALISSELRSPDTLFWTMAVLLAIVLLAWTG